MNYTNIDFNNKIILITGGAGFIGSNLVFYFQKNYPNSKIVVLDKFRNNEVFSNNNPKSYGHFKNLTNFKGTIISGDINDIKIISLLKTNYKFDYIFHEAAISDTTVEEQDIMIQTNVNAFEDILKIAIEHDAKVVYASSAATYGDSNIFEIGHEQPNNVYGFSKVMMDNITNQYLKKYNIEIVGLRYFNVYGGNEFFKQKTASTVLQFGLQILNGNAPKLFEKSEEIFRDFVYIEDVIQANIKACKKQVKGVFNVGTSIPRSFQEIVNILQQELNTNFKIEYIPNPFTSQYQFFTQADISRTTKDLGYKPNFSLENGIKAYLPEIKQLYKTTV